MSIDVRGEWRKRAKCIGMDTDIFFGTRITKEARATCAACPVRRECYETAQTPTAEGPYGAHGVWGGTSQTDRERDRAQAANPPPIHKGHGRGAPPKLSEADVRAIRLIYQGSERVSQRELAERFEVSQQQVSNIISGRSRSSHKRRSAA